MKKTKAKKSIIILITVILIMNLSAILYASEVERTDIVCNDINLYDALVEELDDNFSLQKDRDSKTIKIPTDDINSIKELKLTNSSRMITDLAGLQVFTSLEKLNLSGNKITSIEPISGLTTLKNLIISGNTTNITDIDKLSTLVNITDLDLSSSNINDVAFMKNFSRLSVLNLSDNGISSLEPIQGINTLQKLNISGCGSFSRISDDIFCHRNLIELDISRTGIQDLDGIQTNLRNLEVLKTRYLEIELNPIVDKYRDSSGDYVAYLDKLKVLDISYTTKSISFKNISYLSSLTDLYMIDVVGKWKDADTSTKLSLSGIYELQDLNYINLASNNINSLQEIVYLKYNSDGVLEEKKVLGATEIYLQDNNISNISYMSEIEKPIQILNLSYNNISEVTPLDYCPFTSNREIDLRYQEVSLNIFQKASVDQYIILPSIFQDSKTQGSLIYSEDTGFVTKCNDIIDDESIRVNMEEPYYEPGYYNVIINKNKTTKDILTLEITGSSMATGSKITFQLGTSTSYVDSLLFRDANLCSAIKEELAKTENASKVKYLKNAYMIMNINNSAIKNIDILDLSVENIKDLSGMENFTGIENLNLSNNEITTINQLQYCTKMLNLNVSNNKLGNNNTAIEKMTKLISLDLSNTEMTQINSIKTLIDYWTTKKKFTLTNLNISGNGFTDTDIYTNENGLSKGIDKITSLTSLNIASNEIQNIDSLEPLKSTISILDVSQNDIEDITKLSGFTNLVSLNLSSNKIKDISPISNCTKLNELNFSVNKVKDISSLSRISGSGILVKLNMSNNQIEDISAVDKTQISQLLLAENQKVTKVIDENTEGIVSIELPQIFIASNNINSRFYDENNITLSVVGKTDETDISEYCTLSSDATSLEVNADKLTSEIIIAKIQDGNADNTTLAIAAPLKGTITYNPSNETPTNQDITVTITFNRPATITNNEGKNTYTFTENGEFTFEFTDEYGFEGTEKAVITNIDKINPESTEIIKEIVNKKVIVTIKVSEPILQPDGWIPAEDKLSITKTYEQDANDTVKLIDEAGNETSVSIEVKIDKTAPKITGVENGMKYRKSVTPVIEDENLDTVTLTKDEIVVSNYESGTTITEVGLYMLTVTDKFENTTTVSFEIEITDIITSKDEKITVTEEKLTIKNINPKTTPNGLSKKLQADMEYKIIDKKGNEVSDTSNIGTGYKIVMENDKKYTLIVSGDCNGDGNANINDIFKINTHRLKGGVLAEEYLQAADVNKDGKADIRDIFKINTYRLQGGEI